MPFLKDWGTTALIAGEIRLNYAALIAGAERWRKMLALPPGERVLIFAGNSLDWIQAFYGVWKGRGVNVPLDAMSTPEEVRYVLNDCRPAVILQSRATHAVLLEALEGLPGQPRLIDLDAPALPPEAGPGDPFPEADPAATAIILYTSGTTGGAKGVMLSYDNLSANIEGVSVHTGIYTTEDRVLVLLPLHHILPLLGSVVVTLYVGATAVLCPSLNPQDILATLQGHRITIMIGVPRLYHLFHRGIMEKVRARAVGRWIFALAGLISSPALSRKVFGTVHQRFGGSLRFMVSGGAALDLKAHREMLTLGFGLLNGFGMTEAAPMITFTRPGRAKVGSAGEVLPGSEVRIEEGEILARGRQVMQGYYGNPEATAATIDRDGWLHTGDLGHLDAAGFLFVTGRRKEIIVLSNGKNINPEEVERAIMAHTDLITEIGVYEAGDALFAVILPNFERLRERGILNLEEAFRWEILDAYNKRVPSYRRIKDFTLVRAELPKTRLGKLRRFQLPEAAASQARERQERPSAPEPETAEYQAIRDFLAREKGKAVRADDHIEIDLDLDSLDKITLIAFMGSVFGLEMTEPELNANPTVRGLADYAVARRTRFESEETEWGAILRERTEEDLPASGLLHRLLKHSISIGLRVWFRVRVSGLEHLPEGPFIIAPNHQSAADGFLAAVFLPDRTLRRTFFFAKEKHFQIGWRQFLARRSNIITMNIDLDLRGALRKMAAVLRRGQGIVVFPEGTRTRDGSLGTFKKTFAILSREMDVPVVPVAIRGAFEALPRGSRLPRFRAPIRIDFLPPVLPGALSYEELTDQVRARIAARLA
jgi:long-chain acyl-CoA synthetase